MDVRIRPVITAGVIKPGELDYEPFHEPFPFRIHSRSAGPDQTVKSALIPIHQHLARMIENLTALIKHGHFDVAAKDPFQIRSGGRRQILAVQQRNPVGEGLMKAGEHAQTVRPGLALVVGFELTSGIEIGEGEVEGRHQHGDIDDVVGIGAHVELSRHPTTRKHELFVGHPAGHPVNRLPRGSDVP